jgi:hypothetical protein
MTYTGVSHALRFPRKPFISNIQVKLSLKKLTVMPATNGPPFTVTSLVAQSVSMHLIPRLPFNTLRFFLLLHAIMKVLACYP